MLQWMLGWTNITFSTWTTMAVILGVFGVLCTFFGYRLLRFLIAFQGFLIGCMASLLILSHNTELMGWPLLLVSILIGMGVAAISNALYQLGLFLLTGIAGFLVLGTLLGTFMTNFGLICGLAAVGGIGIGILALIFTRPIIIVVTAVSGGWLVAEEVLQYFIFRFQTPDWLLYATAAILMVLGLYIQFAHTARKMR
ncbi:MAG: DUF4203 domain-containing protein [Lachnospirales bacterium]